MPEDGSASSGVFAYRRGNCGVSVVVLPDDLCDPAARNLSHPNQVLLMNRLSQKWRRLFVPVAAVVASVACIGCGGDKGPVLYPVSGIVTVDGEPLEKAGVSFQPDASKGNKLGLFPAGITDASGKYELTLTTKPGAPAGHYKIVVIPYTPPPFGGEVPKASQTIPFNKKFSIADQTDLAFEVTESKTPQTYDIELTK